jgi:hypothetical protein
MYHNTISKVTMISCYNYNKKGCISQTVHNNLNNSLCSSNTFPFLIKQYFVIGNHVMLHPCLIIRDFCYFFIALFVQLIHFIGSLFYISVSLCLRMTSSFHLKYMSIFPPSYWPSTLRHPPCLYVKV